MVEFTPFVTYLIIAITVLTSFAAEQNMDLKEKMLFSPYHMKRNGEWHRFITSGFIHSGYMHLALNMYVLYIFGTNVEFYFSQLFGGIGYSLYAMMYLLGISAAETYSYFKHKDNPAYASLGASGAVASVLFAGILIAPWQGIGLLFVPGLFIPGFVAGILYLLYSAYMSKQNSDRIAHHAHFYGALFGFVFPLLFKPFLIVSFIGQIIEGLPI